MELLTKVVDIIVKFSTLGGALWLLYGAFIVGTALKDKTGPQLQSGIWQIAGAGIILSVSLLFPSIVTLYNGIINIMDNVVMPVASMILALFLVLEMYKISLRTENLNSLGLEIPMKTMIKFVLCKVVMDNLRLILLAMNEISTTLITSMYNIFNTSINSNITNIEKITQTVADMEFGVQLLTSVEVTIIWLLIKFISVMTTVIVTGRMIEIYVLIAISPIPVATIPNSEAGIIAKNFLKNFMAVCLQGAIIYLVVSMFGILVNSVGINVNGAEFTQSLFSLLGYALVLAISLFSTGKWAKSICNAM